MQISSEIANERRTRSRGESYAAESATKETRKEKERPISIEPTGRPLTTYLRYEPLIVPMRPPSYAERMAGA